MTSKAEHVYYLALLKLCQPLYYRNNCVLTISPTGVKSKRGLSAAKNNLHKNTHLIA